MLLMQIGDETFVYPMVQSPMFVERWQYGFNKNDWNDVICNPDGSFHDFVPYFNKVVKGHQIVQIGKEIDGHFHCIGITCENA